MANGYGYGVGTYDITKPSTFRGGSDSSQGGGGNVGTRYSAVLVERPNTSIGEQPIPGREMGETMRLPMARMTQRNTGKVSG